MMKMVMLNGIYSNQIGFKLTLCSLENQCTEFERNLDGTLVMDENGEPICLDGPRLCTMQFPPSASLEDREYMDPIMDFDGIPFCEEDCKIIFDEAGEPKVDEDSNYICELVATRPTNTATSTPTVQSTLTIVNPTNSPLDDGSKVTTSTTGSGTDGGGQGETGTPTPTVPASDNFTGDSGLSDTIVGAIGGGAVALLLAAIGIVFLTRFERIKRHFNPAAYSTNELSPQSLSPEDLARQLAMMQQAKTESTTDISSLGASTIGAESFAEYSVNDQTNMTVQTMQEAVVLDYNGTLQEAQVQNLFQTVQSAATADTKVLHDTYSGQNTMSNYFGYRSDINSTLQEADMLSPNLDSTLQEAQIQSMANAKFSQQNTKGLSSFQAQSTFQEAVEYEKLRPLSADETLQEAMINGPPTLPNLNNVDATLQEAEIVATAKNSFNRKPYNIDATLQEAEFVPTLVTSTQVGNKISTIRKPLNFEMTLQEAEIVSLPESDAELTRI